MKKSLKKLFIIPLAASFLVSCGTDNPSTSSSAQTSETPTSQPSSSVSEETSQETSLEASSEKSSEAASSESQATSESQEPEVIHVSSVSLSEASLSLHIGESKELTASVLPDNADDKRVTWSSDHDEIATVENGKVTAKQVGKAKITVTSVDGGKTATCDVEVLEDVITFALREGTGNVSTKTANINYDLKKDDRVQLDITKNGEEWFDAEVTTSIVGDEGIIDSIEEVAEVDNAFDVVFSGKTGTATVNFALKDKADAGVVSVTYNISEYFLNQTIVRGKVEEKDDKITFPGGDQHTAVVKKADTNWVLKATLDITKYTGDQSVGLGSFVDNGDTALWFGLRNIDSTADEYAGLYVFDFLAGWNVSRVEAPMPEAYKKAAFPETEDGSAITVDFEVIRKGLEYYYNIGGYHGTYTSSYAAATYAGFFSQEKQVGITNYSIAYGEEAAASAIGDKYGEDAKLDAGCFVDPNLNEIVRGESRTFSVSTAPTYSKETYIMEADSAYAEHVTIDGLKISVKDTAPKGEMALTLKSASGKYLDKITLPVEEESSEKSNDQLTVKGGVILNDDGSIVFPESKMNVDGVGNEEQYSSIDYGATLKEKVIGGDFTIEFDVSDYKTNATFPKLMVSLGGKKSQFYLAYGYGGGSASRFETNTRSSQNYNGDWNNTEDFPSFDRNATHHFKIESKNGFYNFYVDGSEALKQYCDGNARSIIVPVGSFYTALPVRISTKGVSAKVSNIKVTSGDVASMQDVYTYGTLASKVNDTSVQATFPAEGTWDVRKNPNLGMFESKLFAGLGGAYKVKFDVAFSKQLTDAKLGIAFGSGDDAHEFHICSAKSGNKVENYAGHWGGSSLTNTVLNNSLSIPVTIENDGNGTVTFITKSVDGQEIKITDSGVFPTVGMSFWTFNGTAEDVNATVTISNVEIEK